MAQNRTSIRCIRLDGTVTEDWVSVFLPVPKQFEEASGDSTPSPSRLLRDLAGCACACTAMFAAASGCQCSFPCHYEVSATAIDGHQVSDQFTCHGQRSSVGMALLLLSVIHECQVGI